MIRPVSFVLGACVLLSLPSTSRASTWSDVDRWYKGYTDSFNDTFNTKIHFTIDRASFEAYDKLPTGKDDNYASEKCGAIVLKTLANELKSSDVFRSGLAGIKTIECIAGDKRKVARTDDTLQLYVTPKTGEDEWNSVLRPSIVRLFPEILWEHQDERMWSRLFAVNEKCELTAKFTYDRTTIDVLALQSNGRSPFTVCDDLMKSVEDTCGRRGKAPRVLQHVSEFRCGQARGKFPSFIVKGQIAYVNFSKSMDIVSEEMDASYVVERALRRGTN